MKIIIVNCFDTYEDRVDLLYNYFIGKGHTVSVVQSDFRHFQKIKRTDIKQGFRFINVKKYHRNMSLARLISHNKFAKDAFKLIELEKPDLLYVLIPPNSLAKCAANYKSKYKNTKLIFDLIDLWPEAMPIAKFKKTLIFKKWRKIRDESLKLADFVITECDLYQEVLKDVLDFSRSKTIYLAKHIENEKFDSCPVLEDKSITLCYLGSINNIIDIPTIARIIKELSKWKPINLKIIGDGEQKNTLIKAAEEAGAKTFFYGKIYDSTEKKKIFETCHFGLNIMKDSVCVGLTMKSIDYFEAGLPIINNIRYDTEKLVNDFRIGVNLDNNKVTSLVSSLKIEGQQGFLLMRANARRVFEEFFSINSFYESLNEIDINNPIELG